MRRLIALAASPWPDAGGAAPAAARSHTAATRTSARSSGRSGRRCRDSQVQVLNYDDRLLLINRTGKTVLVRGYESEPYARLRADGTVEVNKRSPSYYLNEERYGGTPVPASASPKAPPRWSVVSKTGRFETHDHRIHWMSKGATPPQVNDKGKRTKVFDWRVPIEVGSPRAAADGHALLGAELRRRDTRRPRSWRWSCWCS